MPSRDRIRSIGEQQSEVLVRTIARELRELRVQAGVTQAQLASASGLPRSYVLRLERGRLPRLDIRRTALLFAMLGQRLSVKAYPVGRPLRDAGQQRLLDDLDRRLAPTWRRQRESVMLIPGDLRAWDERLDGVVSIGVDAETVLRDRQATERAMAAKQRDSGVTRMVLLVRGSRRNRAILRDELPSMRQMFPLTTREVLAALGAGRDPGANGIVVL
jgi:transcriptional regulator with XRE-family HTH domain